MAAPGDIPAGAFLHAFEGVCSDMTAARDELCELDAAAGDGDLGVTIATGFQAGEAYLAGSDEADPGTALVAVGGEFARKAPSTIGALLATAFMRGGKAIQGSDPIDAAAVAALLDAAATGVAERGRASAGERTVLDAMRPAADAALAAAGEGATGLEALRRAAAAGRAGAEATAEMEPRHGRAGWIPDRARGKPDAGAAAWAMFLASLETRVGAET